jgi:hypothetical protein
MAIPSREADFDRFYSHFCEYASAKVSAQGGAKWTHIPQSEVDALLEHHAKWSEAFGKTRGPHTTEDTKQKNRVRAAAVKFLREFINSYIRAHKAVTNEQRDQIRVGNRTTTRSRRREVSEMVKLSVKIVDEGILEFSSRVEGAAGRGKPVGYNGTVYAWAFSESTPKSPAELLLREFASSSTITMKFSGEDRGKRVWVSAAWQNGSGVIGKFCAAQTRIVP